MKISVIVGEWAATGARDVYMQVATDQPELMNTIVLKPEAAKMLGNALLAKAREAELGVVLAGPGDMPPTPRREN